MTGSGGQRRVPDAYLRSARVPLPSLAERMRIAALLDQIESLRAKRRRAIALLGELQQSIFLDMFGDPGVNSRDWPLLPLKDLATVFSDGPFGSNLKSAHYEQEGVRVVRLQNIGVGEFLDADAAYVSHEHFANLRKHACTPGDVLVATLGDPNIRACIQPQSLELALNKADCVQIRVDEERADRQYVCALLNQPGLERKASSMMQGQTRVRISMGRLRELEVPLPPLDRQVEFKRRKAAIDTLKESHRTQLATLDELFISLQHRAFNGRLGNTTPPTPCADARAGEPSPPSTTLHATAVAEQSRLF